MVRCRYSNSISLFPDDYLAMQLQHKSKINGHSSSFQSVIIMPGRERSRSAMVGWWPDDFSTDGADSGTSSSSWWRHAPQQGPWQDRQYGADSAASRDSSRQKGGQGKGRGHKGKQKDGQGESKAGHGAKGSGQGKGVGTGQGMQEGYQGGWSSGEGSWRQDPLPPSCFLNITMPVGWTESDLQSWSQFVSGIKEDENVTVKVRGRKSTGGRQEQRQIGKLRKKVSFIGSADDSVWIAFEKMHTLVLKSGWTLDQIPTRPREPNAQEHAIFRPALQLASQGVGVELSPSGSEEEQLGSGEECIREEPPPTELDANRARSERMMSADEEKACAKLASVKASEVASRVFGANLVAFVSNLIAEQHLYVHITGCAQLKFAFYSTTLNRNHQILWSLPINLLNMARYKNVRLYLADFNEGNTHEELKAFIQEHLEAYVRIGTLQYFHCGTRHFWHASICKNAIAFEASNWADVLVNWDNDRSFRNHPQTPLKLYSEQPFCLFRS